MSNRPLVVIILVNYNGYDDTIACIKSLKKITYENYKIIVVNNGSSIAPKAEQKDFLQENSYYLDNRENTGFSGGNNIGIRYAEQFNPKYFLLLNNDTEVKEDFLDVLVNTAELNPDAGLLCGKIYFYNSPDRIWYGGAKADFDMCTHTHYKCQYNAIDNDFSDRVEDIDFATGCMWLLPVSVVKKVGYLDEKFFLYCEDDEYCYRLIKNKYRILYCNKAIIYHKVSASTGVNSPLQQYYIARNILYIVDMYAKKKFKARCLNYIRWAKAILRGRKNLKPIFKAYIDYKKGKTGKADI